MEKKLPSTESKGVVKNGPARPQQLGDTCSSSQTRDPKNANKFHSSGPNKTPKIKERGSPSRLSPTEVTLHVKDFAKSISCQIDTENESRDGFLRLDEHLTEGDCYFRDGIFETNDSNRRTRIITIFKQVLKKCGYVLAATVAVPLIAGEIKFFFVDESMNKIQGCKAANKKS